MSTQLVTKPIPLSWFNTEAHLSMVASAVNNILKGKTNNTGTVTLAANQSTTVVPDTRVGDNSCITFMPTTANAAAEIGAGLMYVTLGSQTFTITHANNAQTNRDF